jgi:hypothetical protein
MTDSFAIEIARLREEVHAWRMQQMRESHALDIRLRQMDAGLREHIRRQAERWKSQAERDKRLSDRLKVFEEHKSNVAWLGWSVSGALALGVLKLWAPTLAALF